MALYKISSSRVNNIDADQYAGSVVEEGLIWYDPNDGLLRLYNGNVGGYIINAGGGGGGSPVEIDFNGNVVTSNVQILNFTGNGVNVTSSGNNVTVDITTQAPTNLIELGNSNVRVWPDGNVTVSILGNANTAIFTSTSAQFSDVIANNFIGNGSQLTNLTGANVVGNVANATYASLANVANYANTAGFANTANTAISANVANTASYANTAGLANLANVASYANTAGSADTANTASYANTAGLANVANYANTAGSADIANTASYANTAGFADTSNVANYANTADTANTAVTVTGNAQPNITSVGTLVSLSVGGNIQTAANISGSYFFGNGRFLTGISGGSGNASFPPQTGNAGLVLMTDGSDVYWNSGLAASYTFEGGVADSAMGNAILDGGGATADYTGEAAIYGGVAGSDYSLTLSSVALTGQYEDLEDAPNTTPVPATANSAGQKGQMAFDNNYLYVCVANDTWRRATLNSW